MTELRAEATPTPDPPWARPEPRWPMVIAVAVAVGLQVILPGRFAPAHRLVPTLELVLLVGLVAANPGRIDTPGRWLRRASIALVAMITVTNAWSAVRLVQGIVTGADDDAIALHSSGAAIWATNVVVFGLWYWEFDRGGPHARLADTPAEHAGGKLGDRAASDRGRALDFAYPQHLDPHLAAPGWAPRFVDYLYLWFTNGVRVQPDRGDAAGPLARSGRRSLARPPAPPETRAVGAAQLGGRLMAGPPDDPGPPHDTDRPGGFRMPGRGDPRRGDTRPGDAANDGQRRRPGSPPPAAHPNPRPAGTPPGKNPGPPGKSPGPPPGKPVNPRPGPPPDRPPAPPGRPPAPPPGGPHAGPRPHRPPPRPPAAPGRAPGGRAGPNPTRVAPTVEPDRSPIRAGASSGASGGGASGPRAVFERVRAAASKRVLLLVLAAASALLLLVSGGIILAARTVDSGLSRVDVISPSLSSVLGTDQNILLVGLDTRTDSFGNPLPADQLAALHAGGSNDGGDQTDTIIVVHIPGDGGPVTGFSIPRDSYVDLPDGYGKHKINAAYAYGQNAARPQLIQSGVTGNQLAIQSGAEGAKTSIGAVESLTGLTITHFAAVNLAGFADISTAVGGVPVCLNSPVNDPFSGAHFPAGPQTVSGAQALAFVRQRHGLPGGDLDRARRQQVFLSSMAHTVLSSNTLTDTDTRSALLAAVDKALTVDQSLDVLTLAGQLPGLSGGSIGFHTIPIVNASYDTPDDGEAVQVDPAAVQKYIDSTITAASTTSAAPPPAAVASGPSAPPAGSAAAATKTSGAPTVPSPETGTAAPAVPCVN